MKSSVWFGILRIAMGWIFLWAFLDKLFGLGFSTCRDATTKAVDVMCAKAWLLGASPTMGFLKMGTKGPFAELFQGMAGSPVVDWLFMLGLLGIGVALILGIGMRIAAVSGVIMMLLMYFAAILPANNPVVDDHIIYALVFLALGFSHAGDALGLGPRWRRTTLVKAYPVLE